MKNMVERTFWGDFLSITIKSTYLCNLNCKYCYQKGYNFDLPYKIMPDHVVDATIKKLSELPVKTIDLQWIGGETTIPGLKFFKNVCRLSRLLSKNGPKIFNQIQTNASLLNDAWCEFLNENSEFFSLSISHDFFEDFFILNQSSLNSTRIIRKIKKIS